MGRLRDTKHLIELYMNGLFDFHDFCELMRKGEKNWTEKDRELF